LAGGLGLLFFTAFYPAWFFVFALGLFSLGNIVFASIVDGPRTVARNIARFLRIRGPVLLGGAIAFSVSLIPFVITYGPLVRSNQVRGFDLVLGFAPTLPDVVNVSRLNLVWAPILQSLRFDFGSLEVQLGSPIFVLLISLAAAIALMIQRRRSGWIQTPTLERCLLLLAVTAVALVALCIKVDGLSLWFAVYKFVPGASAVRATGRILMIVDIIIIVLAMWGLQALYQRLASTNGRRTVIVNAGFSIVAALLIGEQVNGMAFRLDKAEQLSFMSRFAAPPQACKAFFINNSATTDLPFGYYQLDAMMIGMHLGIPTVNGYSGFEPDEAFTLAPNGPEYRYRMMDWLLQNGATDGICELDLKDGSFRSVDVAEERAQGQHAFRMELLDNFSALFEAAQRALSDGVSLAGLHPQYLEQNGYLDPAFGHQTGTHYRWVQDRYWIGERACGNKQCFGVAVVGTYADVRPILERYASQAKAVYFPSPDRLDPNAPPDDASRGELLLVFPTVPLN
jgi:hypothetical protein